MTSPPPAVTDALTAAAVATPPPDYGSCAPYRRRTADPADPQGDHDHDDKQERENEACSPLMTGLMSFEMTSGTSSSPRCNWGRQQWRRFRAWLSLDAVTLADLQ